MGPDHDHRRRHRRAESLNAADKDAPASGGALAGIAAIAVGAVLLGAKGLFAKILYARGMDHETVVALRAVLAVPGFVLLAFWLRGNHVATGLTVRNGLRAAVAGVVCYAVGASANFYALTLIDASIERALLYSYPALIVVALWLRSGRRPRAATVLAVAATWAGIALTVGLPGTGVATATIVGAAWVLFCSATIAYYFVVSASLTRAMGSAPFTAVAMTAAGVTLALYYQVRHGWGSVQLDAITWLWMLVLVIFVTVLPLYLVAEGVRRVGAQRGAIASTVGPPSAALLAVAFLGERVSFVQLLGIALIVCGVVFLELRERKSGFDAPASGRRASR